MLPNPLAPENAVAGIATVAGLGGALATTGLDPLTVALTVLFAGVVRQLMAANASMVAEHAAHREAVKAHVETIRENYRDIRARNRPLLREHLDWRDARAHPSKLEIDLSSVQAAAVAEDERIAKDD